MDRIVGGTRGWVSWCQPNLPAIALNLKMYHRNHPPSDVFPPGLISTRYKVPLYVNVSLASVMS